MTQDGNVMCAEDVHKSFGRLEVLKGIDLEVRARREGLHHRRLRIGKVDVPSLHQPPREDRLRPDRGQRPSHRLPRGERARSSRTPRTNIAKQRSEIGMVFQRFNLFPHMTALENVIEAPVHVRRMRKASCRRAGEALLARVGLADKRDTYPGAALGRPAAARRDRPRAGDEARADALRRADERARPRGDRRGARRHGGARSRGHDDDRRHARDGLRARGGGPRRDDGRRQRSSKRARRSTSSTVREKSARSSSSRRSSSLGSADSNREVGRREEEADARRALGPAAGHRQRRARRRG